MGSVTTCVAVCSGILAAITLGLIKDEAAAWLPLLTERIIKLSADRLKSKDLRIRYYEEWSSHNQEYPGKLGQLIQALFCVKASFGLAPLSNYYRLLITLLLVSNAVIALGVPAVFFNLFPECKCSSTLSWWQWLLMAIPLTIFSLLLDLFIKHKGWMHHKRRRVG